MHSGFKWLVWKAQHNAQPLTFFHFLSPLSKPHFLPKHLEITKKEDEAPLPNPSQFAHINQLHTASTYQYSECGPREAVRGGLRWAWGFAIQPHSQEPLKCPASIMESLIGAHSARKVFSEKKEGEREREKKVLGEATTYVRCLEYVQFIQASIHKSPISHFFFFFWLFRRIRRKKEENNKSLLKGLYREFGVLFSSILVDGVNSLSRSEYRPKSRYCLDVRCFSPLRAPSISCASHSYMCSHMCKQQMSCLGV